MSTPTNGDSVGGQSPEQLALSKAEAQAREEVAAAERAAAGETVVVPSVLPPTPPGQQLNLNVGMQLVQQSAAGFDRLDKAVQQQMLTLAEKMDRHAFENAQSNLQCNHEARLKGIEGTTIGRKQVLILVGSLAGAGLVAGTVITGMLIHAGQSQLAHTVMMSGLGVVGSLLGGAGITTLLRDLGGSKKGE